MELLLPTRGRMNCCLKKKKKTIQRIYFFVKARQLKYLVSFVGFFGFYFFVAVDSYLFFNGENKFIIFIFFICIFKTLNICV